jgi:hypothetical protein
MSLKSLNVKIYLEENFLDLTYPILLDDSIINIKDKLFLDENYAQIPELIKLQIFNENEDMYINITNRNHLIYEYYDDLLIDEKLPELYISNLLDDPILHNKKSNDILSDKEQLNNLLNELIHNGYFDLDITDLEFVLMTKTKSNIYEEEINRYNNLKLKQRINLANKFPNDNLLIEFQKISSNDKIDLGDYKITINDISIKIIGNNVENGVRGPFIKLNEIFNTFELNEQIPFIALSKRNSNTKTPQIKAYNNILNAVSDKEIKSWVLNEKKKLNQATYKIIKGLLIKSRLENSKTYISINILSNGEIYANALFSKDDIYSSMNYDDIYNIIIKNIDEIIVKLNTFQGVFLQSKRISSINNSNINVDSIDSSIQTDFEINRNKLSNLLNSDFIREHIFEKKDTESNDVFSAYYKKIKNNGDDTKGITINIRDNSHLENSSIVNIYAASNLNQTIIILANIYILYILSLSTNKNGYFDIKTSERLIKKISQMKILKKEGVENLNSAKCQAPRHPDINHDNLDPIDDSYILTYKNKDFRCPNVKYPYPGFTNSDIVCCFKNAQKGNVNYIRNIDKEALTIEVEPSNFKVKITNGKKKSFDTFVIRVISDYRNGLNEDNSVSRYYYLEQDLKNERPLLTPITNKDLIDTISKEDNIWLNAISLSKIIYPSSKTECSFKPNLNNTGSKFKINSPCDEHKNMPFFRYKNTSIPCCFDKEISPYLTAKSKKNNTNQYILTSDTKILNPGKLAYLPNELINLFNELSPNYKDLFYRQGIIKDEINSFLYVILLAIDNKIKSKKITNYIEFKNIIYKYLVKNINEFNKLNNGDLLLKYSNIDSYIKSFDKNVNWFETIELLEKIIKKNIIIIDIKEQGKEQGIESRVLCRPKGINPNKFDRPFIILLKRQKYFELLVRVTIPKSNNYIIDRKEFSADDNIIKFLLKYYKDSCIKKNDYPVNYGEPIENDKIIPYIPLLKSDNIDNILNNIKNKELGYIKYQLENDFHKINYLMTNKGIILPIFETGIISTEFNNKKLKVISLSSLITQTSKLLDLKTYKNVFKLLNTSKTLKKTNDFIKIIGITQSNYPNIGGLLTNFGAFIPYKINKNDKIENIEQLSYKYYIDIDKYINNTTNEINEFNEFSIYTNKQNDEIFNIKKNLGNIFSNDETLKEQIYNIIIDTQINKGIKINNIYNIIKPKISSQFQHSPSHIKEILLKNIINDMLNDNKENLILNNIIVSDNFNKDDIIVRDSESVLFNVNDIRNWIKVNKSEE